MSSASDNFPNHPIKIIVGYAPGGGADIMGRLIGDELSKNLNTTVVIENRPGAGQNIAASYVARAPADGYTLLMSSSALAVNISLYPSQNYDPVKDFQPVAVFAQSPNVLVVRASLPFKSVSDLVSYAKQNSGTLNYSSSGAGSTQHLYGELLNIKMGINSEHVPYKGTGPSINAVLSGEVHYSFMNVPSADPHLKSGQFKALAIASPKRSAVLPEVPTMEEAGISGMDTAAWYGILAPAGTPKEVVEKLNKAVNAVVKRQDFEDRLIGLGATPLIESSEYFEHFLKQDVDRWAAVIKRTGITLN